MTSLVTWLNVFVANIIACPPTPSLWRDDPFRSITMQKVIVFHFIMVQAALDCTAVRFVYHVQRTFSSLCYGVLDYKTLTPSVVLSLFD